MSWHYSQALVAEYLAANSSDGAQSAPSNGSPTPLLYLPPDRMRAFSRLSRFGMTFKPLTDDLGAGLLTWYLEGFRAKISAAPERGQELPESGAECGSTWRGSLARYDRNTRSWRTVQYSLLGDLTLFSGTWPRWGTMRNGECTAQPTSEIATCENDFGFALLTPTASDHKRANLSSPCWQKRKNGGVRKAPGTLPEQLAWMGFAGMLAPTLPEKMLCFPNGWTDLRPLATLSIAEWCALHGIPYTND
jgi:hypothetical protein